MYSIDYGTFPRWDFAFPDREKRFPRVRPNPAVGTPVHAGYGERKEWRTTEHQWTLRIVIFRRISAASMSDNRHWTKSRWRRRQPTLRDEHVEKKWGQGKVWETTRRADPPP